MPSSPALGKFSGRLSEVEALIALSSTPEAGIPAQATAVVSDNALLRGALVLLCSHIEGFLEDLICDALRAYCKLAQKAVQFPRAIRVYQVLGKSPRWTTTDHMTRWNLVQECMRHPLAHDESDIIATSLDADLHVRGFANPGTGEISDLFRSVGIADLWDSFSIKEPDQLFKNSIDAIVNRRNQIAHGNLESTVTRADVETYVIRARRVASVMDEIVGEAIGLQLALGDVWDKLGSSESNTAIRE